MAQQDSEQVRWFVEEVQSHEPALRAYLHREFPRLTDIDDVVQESYLKILRANLDGKLRSARGFLFTVARNVALDVFRRRRTAPFLEAVPDTSCKIIDGGPGAVDAAMREQELGLLAQAIESLPSRCRQVLKLRMIYGLSHKEIAARLQISERTVNVQIGAGIRRCSKYLRVRGFLPLTKDVT